MNKLILLLGTGVIVVGAGTAAVVMRKKDDNTVNIANTSANQSQDVKTGESANIAVDACDVLTESAAKLVLGDGAVKGDTAAGNASTNEVSVSNCTYTFKTNTSGTALAQAQSSNVAGILVRAAKSTTGADANKAVFGASKQSGVEDVSGYGDKAFWNPTYGQLNILKGNNWYILSHYTGLNATKGTLEQAKVLADAVKDNIK